MRERELEIKRFENRFAFLKKDGFASLNYILIKNRKRIQ